MTLTRSILVVTSGIVTIAVTGCGGRKEGGGEERGRGEGGRGEGGKEKHKVGVEGEKEEMRVMEEEKRYKKEERYLVKRKRVGKFINPSNSTNWV